MSVISEFLSKARGESLSIGVDIGHYSIKLVQVEHTSKGRRLVGAGIHVLKPGTLSDGAIQDENSLRESLVALINRSMPDGVNGDVLVSLAWSSGVIADRIFVQSQDGTSDEEVILFEASNRSPFDDQDITLDHKILGKNETSGEMEVLLVAAKTPVLNKWSEFFISSGVQPSVMDIDSFAICNAYTLTEEEGDEEKAIGLLNIGEQRAVITFLRDGKYHSTREIQSAAVDYYVKSVSRTMNVDSEKAQQLLRGETDDKLDGNALKGAIDYASEELSIGVDLAMQYFQSTENNRNLDRLILTGGGACIPGVTEYLSHKLEIPVSTLHPMKNLDYEPELFGGEIPESVSNILVVALGMAMRKV